MAITKGNIRDFLSAKRQSLMDEKVKPLKEERQELKRQAKLKAFNKIEMSQDWELMAFIDKYLELTKEAAKIRDDAGLTWGFIRDLGGNNDETKEHLVDNTLYVFGHGLHEITYPPRVQDLEVQIQDLEVRIRSQFRKLEALVASNSAKQCVVLLKEAGFDTDDLELRFATPKNEVKALDIDHELMGLPEQAKKVETNA